MSEVAQETSVEKLISLSREYVQALTDIRCEIEALSAPLTAPKKLGQGYEFELVHGKLSAILSRFQRLKPALEQLVRTASQIVEHSRTMERIAGTSSQIAEHSPRNYDELALRIRLADLEGSLLQTEQLLSESLAAARR